MLASAGLRIYDTENDATKWNIKIYYKKNTSAYTGHSRRIDTDIYDHVFYTGRRVQTDPGHIRNAGADRGTEGYAGPE